MKYVNVTRATPVFNLPGGSGEPCLSIYRSVLVNWDEDYDARILDFIDDMTEEDRFYLLATHEHEGGIWFIWNGPAPKAYEKIDQGVATRSGDHWSIMESVELNSDDQAPTA